VPSLESIYPSLHTPSSSLSSLSSTPSSSSFRLSAPLSTARSGRPPPTNEPNRARARVVPSDGVSARVLFNKKHMGMYHVFYMNIIHVYNYIVTICLYSVITLLCSKPQARPPREKVKELNENRVVVVRRRRSLAHSLLAASSSVAPRFPRRRSRRLSTLARSSGAYLNQNPVQTKPNRSTVVTTD